MLKRWWWAGAAVIVLIVGSLLFVRPAATAPPAGTGQTAGAPGFATPGAGTASATVGETSTPRPSAGSEATASIAKSGSKLATVTAPPQQTLAQIKYSATRDGQLYSVRFKPFWTGPTRSGHGTLVAAVSSFTPQKSYSDALRLPGANVLFELGPGVSVTSGGAYSGVAKLTKSGSALVMVLTSVKPL